MICAKHFLTFKVCQGFYNSICRFLCAIKTRTSCALFRMVMQMPLTLPYAVTHTSPWLTGIARIANTNKKLGSGDRCVPPGRAILDVAAERHLTVSMLIKLGRLQLANKFEVQRCDTSPVEKSHPGYTPYILAEWPLPADISGNRKNWVAIYFVVCYFQE